MSKKNRIQKLFERATIEPADTQPRSPQQSPAAEQPGEANPPVDNHEQAREGSSQETTFADEQRPASMDPEPEPLELFPTDAERPEEEIPSEPGPQEPAVLMPGADEEADEEEPLVSDSDRVQEGIEPVSDDPQRAVTSSEPRPQDERAETDAAADEPSPAVPAGSETSEEPSRDDLLEDVRHSLIEEEVTQSKQGSKWWHRFGRKRKEVEPEEAPANLEIDLPTTRTQMEMMQDQKEDVEPETYAEEIDDLINMLEAERQDPNTEPSAAAAEIETPPPPQPEPEIDFEQRKEQAFRPRPADEEAESVTDVRSIALEDGEEVFVEVQAQEPDLFQDRVKSFENALKPYRRYMYLTLTFLGVVMAVIAALLIFNVYQRSRPVPVREAPNLPYPTSVSLPGGWTFQLGRGAVQAGKWEPQGPEWLEGTEVCRWVSLPWSLQLEAVVRTLDQDDPIELVMSNNDRLVYNVSSVQQMTPEEIQALDSNSPCLLIILTQAESEKRWVLTALP